MVEGSLASCGFAGRHETYDFFVIAMPHSVRNEEQKHTAHIAEDVIPELTIDDF